MTRALDEPTTGRGGRSPSQWRAALGIIVLGSFLGGSGCQADGLDVGFGVALTLRFALELDDAQIARVGAFEFSSSGGETFRQVLPLERPANRLEHLVYRPKSDTQRLSLHVVARTVPTDGSAGEVVAEGTSAAVELRPGQTSQTEVLLTRPTVDGGGAVDLSPPGDLARPPCAGALCFSFENDVGDSSALLTADPSCLVVTGAAHGGTHHGRCSTTSGGPNFYLAMDLGSSQAVVAFRAWMRIKPEGSLVFANFAGLADDTVHYLLVGTDGNSHLSANYTAAGGSTPGIASAASADTQNLWRCVEVVATRPSGVALYVDGTLVAQANDLLIPPTYKFVLLGINKPSQGNDIAIQADIDDVVIGYRRIGCD